MNAEHTIDTPARAGRAIQIAAMVITGLAAVSWLYFGMLYLIHDPGEWRVAHQQLGYPLYIIPLLGVTHILGGVGVLIPNVPRLTEWVYAGLVINLLLAFYSQLNGGGSTWEKFDPILVLAFVVASYGLRRRCAQIGGQYEEHPRRVLLLPSTPLVAPSVLLNPPLVSFRSLPAEQHVKRHERDDNIKCKTRSRQYS
jgi:hypothetical protein